MLQIHEAIRTAFIVPRNRKVFLFYYIFSSPSLFWDWPVTVTFWFHNFWVGCGRDEVGCSFSPAVYFIFVFVVRRNTSGHYEISLCAILKTQFCRRMYSYVVSASLNRWRIFGFCIQLEFLFRKGILVFSSILLLLV